VAPLASHKDTVESEDVLAEASSLLWRENRMSMHLRSLASALRAVPLHVSRLLLSAYHQGRVQRQRNHPRVARPSLLM
jgi:hypothetical protein